MDADGVDVLDDHLSGHELLDRLVAAAIPAGHNKSVGHGGHFIPDVIGNGTMVDPHAISQFQRVPYEIVGPEEHLDPAPRLPFLNQSQGEMRRGVG